MGGTDSEGGTRSAADGSGACCDRTVVWNAYERMAVRLRRVAYRVCRDGHEAEDVVHDTMLAAHQSVHTLRDLARLEPWMMKIAKNQAATTARRRRRLRMDDRDLSEAAAADAGTDGFAARFASSEPAADAVMALRAALDAAPPMWRDAFHARIVQGLPFSQIAASQGVTVACVKTRVTRVRKRLCDAIRPSR